MTIQLNQVQEISSVIRAFLDQDNKNKYKASESISSGPKAQFSPLN